MKLALAGYGNVGKPLLKLIQRHASRYPFRVTGIHTARHGTALDPGGIQGEPTFGPPASSIEEFLDQAKADVLVELTPLNPWSGEPAISHIRAAFRRGMHVVTANKGPIACAYSQLKQEAGQAGVHFLFEAAVMDAAPVFRMVRKALPGARILGFAGVLNSTTRVVIQAMRAGRSLEQAVEEARRLGIAESDVSLDLQGWDAAAKTAALANVLLGAGVTTQAVDTEGIQHVSAELLSSLAQQRKTICLVSRAFISDGELVLQVRPEVFEETHPMACVPGTSNLLLLETDLAGTIGIVSLNPTVQQTAGGVFSDLVDITIAAARIHLEA